MLDPSGPIWWSWSFSPGGDLRFREAVVLKSEWVEPLFWFPKGRGPKGRGWHCSQVRCPKNTSTLRRIEAREEGMPVNSTRGETVIICWLWTLRIHAGARIEAFPA